MKSFTAIALFVVGIISLGHSRSLDAAEVSEGLLLRLPLVDNLTTTSTAPTPTNAKGSITFKDGAAWFDGKSWVDLPDLRFDEPFAVSVWLNASQDQTTYGILEERESNVKGHHFHLMLRDLHPRLGFYVNDLLSPTQIAPNRWTHLVFQFDGKYQQIWVDGGLRCQRVAKKYLGKTGVPHLGKTPRWTNVPSSDYKGGMSDFRVYGRALSPSEIASLARMRPPDANRENNSSASPETVATANLVPTLFIDADRLKIVGTTGQVYTLEVTSTLDGPWQPLTTITNMNGKAEFVDSEASKFSERFYRIKVQ